MTRRRLLALGALVLAPLAVLSAAGFAAADPGEAIGVFLSLSLALIAGSYGLVRRGVVRVLALVLAGMLVVGVLGELLDGRVLDRLIIAGLLWLAVSAACAAFAIQVPLPKAVRPRRPVLFLNPRSGGGAAVRLQLADEARKRGIEPVELGRGDDLATLVRAASDGGADALAMAGGDGSQAVVAAIAAERGLPYACIPAGTRNHFALDLGVDRDDVVGALDAFVDGGERVVDLAEVNGRVFVNNVSLGLYATAVQREGYRGAKLRTLLDTFPDVIGPEGRPPDLRWTGPDGTAHRSGTVLMISNNRYRLGWVPGSGTRPRLDGGELGVAVAEPAADRGWRRLLPRRPWSAWSARDFEVRSAEQVPAGIDGEAGILTAPLRFRILPRVLRVRIAPTHPGASPSATRPANVWLGFRALVSIAAGRPPLAKASADEFSPRAESHNEHEQPAAAKGGNRMTEHRIGTREEWLAARNELLERENEHAKRSEELARERRELPWVPVEKEYTFDTDEGRKTLAELFDGRSQLLAYNIMFGPDYTGACPGCSNLADHLDAALVHLGHRDVTLMCFSRAPLEKLQAYKRRMGWQFPWASTYGSDFPFDFGFAFTAEQMAAIEEVQSMIQDPPDWLQDWSEQVGTGLESGLAEGPGWMAFALEDGVVYHTYSRLAPDRDFVVPYYHQLLDRTPNGRVEDFRAWRKDEYPDDAR